MAEHESSLAVLVDFENMARPGVKGRGDFDIHLVLNRLADKGRVLVKRAYADWSRYRDARHDLQNAGLELIEMPSAREGAKNRADIKMAVDAMELAFSREHLDTFVIVSGDSDFTPLVGKVRELNKRVIGVGNRESASELLIANCDEFIYYDLLAASRRSGTSGGRTLDPDELLRQTLLALQREGTEWPLASVVKDSMRRRNPAFDETEAGFSTFSKFLEAVGTRGLIRLETDQRSGTYRVELAEGGSTSSPEAVAAAEAAREEEAEAGGPRRRRRRRRGEPGEPKAETTGEVFEFVVSPAEAAAPEPEIELPLDRALTYEDMIMLGPELAASDVPELVEATDQPEEPAGRRRRRRRGGAEAEADAAPAVEAVAEAPAAEAPAAEEAPAGSRRRRRRTTATEEAPAETPVAEAAPEPVAEAPVEEPAAEAEAAQTEEPAAPSRRRVRRGTRAVAEEAPAETPAETPAEAPAAEEAPAPKRRTRTRKAATEEAPAAEAPAAEEAPAPKRRARTRKAATEEAPAETPAAEEAPAEEKPKRRTRTRKAAAEEAPAAEAPAAEEAPAPKRRTRTRKAAATEE